MSSSYRSRRPAAQLLTRTVGDGVTAFMVDCRYGTTTLLQIPGRLFLPDGGVILAVAYWHEEECGRCDVEPVLARGDQSIRAKVDRLELLLAVRERVN